MPHSSPYPHYTALRVEYLRAEAERERLLKLTRPEPKPRPRFSLRAALHRWHLI